MRSRKIFILFLLLGTVPARAQELCTGYNAETGKWGLTELTYSVDEAHCQRGSAFVAHQLAFGMSSDKDVKHFAPSGSCCPLPEGALSDEHTYAAVACPQDHVVTGARVSPNSPEHVWQNHGKISYELRCTKINLERYHLGKPSYTYVTDAGEDGVDVLKRYVLGEAPHTTRGLVPPSLRYGVGRTGRTSWATKICVGYPWGSVLTRLGARGCKDFVFRPLIPAPGQPPIRTPRCLGVKAIYSEEAACIP